MIKWSTLLVATLLLLALRITYAQDTTLTPSTAPAKQIKRQKKARHNRDTQSKNLFQTKRSMRKIERRNNRYQKLISNRSEQVAELRKENKRLVHSLIRLHHEIEPNTFQANYFQA